MISRDHLDNNRWCWLAWLHWNGPPCWSLWHGSQLSNCFSSLLSDFDYFKAKKHPKSTNWAYEYLIKISLLWSRLPRAKKKICSSLVLWNIGNTADWSHFCRKMVPIFESPFYLVEKILFWPCLQYIINKWLYFFFHSSCA